jgi:hypothetical protein
LGEENHAIEKMKIQSIERERERVPWAGEEKKNCEDVWLPHARVSGTHRFKEMNQPHVLYFL